MSYILTNTGRKIYFDEVEKSEIHVEDIVRSLPRLNRFVGHSETPFSVGKHTVLCCYMAKRLNYSPRETLLVLIHDFAEAYTGDVPAPLKDFLPTYKIIEEKMMMQVYKHLNIEPPSEHEQYMIDRIDKTMVLIEMKNLTKHDYKSFYSNLTYTDIVSDKSFNKTMKSIDQLSELDIGNLIIMMLMQYLDKEGVVNDYTG